MNKRKRIEKILKFVNENGELTVEDACERFSSSPATIRRDFGFLSEKKVVAKSWGGIMTLSGNSVIDSMTPVSYRKSEFLNEKQAIAKKAASLVKDGDILIIDGGTTTLEMIPFLSNLHLKIITNSILIALEIENLKNKHQLEVFLTGGMLYPGSGLLVSTQASDTLKNFHANWLFLSTGGVSEVGMSNSNILVVETERSMIMQSEKVVLLADSSKIGKKDLVKLCNFNDLNKLITNIDSKSKKTLEGIEVGDLEILFV